MTTVKYRYVLLMGVWATMMLVSAQITFSRDWTGGKRGVSHMDLDCTQFTKLCRHFVHEVKKAMSSELAAKHHKEKEYEEDKSFLYDDE